MANTPIYNMTDTWNAGGTTFNAIKMDVTDTASAAGSKLLDLLVGGSSKFSVSKAGNVAAAGTLTVTGASTLAALGATNGTFSGTLGVTGAATLSSTLAVTGNTTLSGTLGVGGSDCILLREAANELAMRNGTAAQTLRLYNTYTDASNYERGYLRWHADILKIGTEEAGSGTARALELQTDGVTRMTIPATAGRILVGDMTIGRGGATSVASSTAIGFEALNSASLTGNDNVAIGYQALRSQTTGGSNVAVGSQTLYSQTTGTGNLALGHQSLFSNQTGSNNVALGSGALYRNTSGTSNLGLGQTALFSNTTGTSNIALGSAALSSNTTGQYNIGIGNNALSYAISFQQNTAIGWRAGRDLAGENNVLIGSEAGFGLSRGVNALGAITGGSGYTDGTYNGVNLTRSSGSTFGILPTANITVSGGAVTAVTLVTAGTGFQDTDTVLTAAAASIGGTGSGFTVAVASLTGAVSSDNTLIGRRAGDNLTEGSSNIVIGSGVDADSPTGSNQINIGDRFYHDRIRLLERGSDPTKPTEGNTVIWMSDGAGLGDDGDVLIASTAGGVTNYAILFDHSAGTLWS